MFVDQLHSISYRIPHLIIGVDPSLLKPSFAIWRFLIVFSTLLRPVPAPDLSFVRYWPLDWWFWSLICFTSPFTCLLLHSTVQPRQPVLSKSHLSSRLDSISIILSDACPLGPLSALLFQAQLPDACQERSEALTSATCFHLSASAIQSLESPSIPREIALDFGNHSIQPWFLHFALTNSNIVAFASGDPSDCSEVWAAILTPFLFAIYMIINNVLSANVLGRVPLSGFWSAPLSSKLIRSMKEPQLFCFIAEIYGTPIRLIDLWALLLVEKHVHQTYISTPPHIWVMLPFRCDRNQAAHSTFELWLDNLEQSKNDLSRGHRFTLFATRSRAMLWRSTPSAIFHLQLLLQESYLSQLFVQAMLICQLPEAAFASLFVRYYLAIELLLLFERLFPFWELLFRIGGYLFAAAFRWFPYAWRTALLLIWASSYSLPDFTLWAHALINWAVAVLHLQFLFRQTWLQFPDPFLWELPQSEQASTAR